MQGYPCGTSECITNKVLNCHVCNRYTLWAVSGLFYYCSSIYGLYECGNTRMMRIWKKALCHQSYTFVGQATTFSHNSFHISSSQGDLVLFFFKDTIRFQYRPWSKAQSIFLWYWFPAEALKLSKPVMGHTLCYKAASVTTMCCLEVSFKIF